MTMQDMIAFCNAILQSICTFLMTPPIFWLFSLVCFVAIISVVKMLINNR